VVYAVMGNATKYQHSVEAEMWAAYPHWKLQLFGRFSTVTSRLCSVAWCALFKMYTNCWGGWSNTRHTARPWLHFPQRICKWGTY